MIRIGVDFGGTKIEAAAVDDGGAIVARVRAPNPRIYEQSLRVVAEVVAEAERLAGVGRLRVGVGMPGSLSPVTGLIRNANSLWLADRPFPQDLERVLERPVRVSNDANCFALSEAVGGAADGARVVFGAILGTGCGGGVVVDRTVVEGRNLIAGEWGHSPLPWPSEDERAAHRCWCGRVDCLETWISGTAFTADYARRAGETLEGEKIVERARAAEPHAVATLEAYVERLGRGLAVICDILDPDVIVLGGGMSQVKELYDQAPAAIARWVFSDVFVTPVAPAAFGDSSGVRGAAWLWPAD
ncbi:MAG TPA: ROK family protein [Caulobacteraceae bacterium]|nr:ROK family protein [Caulobacteraceae bacterium]